MGKVTAIRSVGQPQTESPSPVLSRKPRQAYVTVRGLSKSFQGTTIYDDFSIELPMGKFISVFGPNGCGKSTFFYMISGLMPMDAGEVLFPWMRAIDNIHNPLKVIGVDRKERRRRVEKLLADFDVPFDLNAYPYTLSGG